MVSIIVGIVIAVLLVIIGFLLKRLNTLLPIAVGVFILGILFSTFISVPAGHVGVTILFGKVDKDVLPEGLHLINPLKNVYNMSVRTQEIFEHADVPSKEGLSVGLEVSLLYHILPENASDIYRNIGEKYADVFIVPLLRSAIRNVTVNHEAKELYTSGREIISGQIFSELDKNLRNRGIIVEAVLLRKIALPDQVQQAINNKLAAEQEAERMKFVILKEEQEAKRKSIEAKGIADFQNIVRQGIDDKLLKWKSLETVNELAKSPNAKFIILGDKSGLPVIVQP
ncbi:MAG: hypothetical protein KatS3mg027_0242 [Bacteroidia bacterium]|nr:MAG: hypothetical protein KatS3mg027_0242 [Bacteroidia bacterium]